MATVTFASTTLWNDASTGFGAVALRVVPRRVLYSYEYLPRGTGRVAKATGTEPGEIALVCQYRMQDSAFASFLSGLAAMVTSFGSLVARGTTYQNLVLEGYEVDQSQPFVEAGVLVRRATVTFRFASVR